MTDAQRNHMKVIADYYAKFKSQLQYPPGDQRTWRDGFFWSLTEQRAESYLKGGGDLQFDCSEWCPWVYRCVGVWHWSEPGYTGSHLEMFANRIYTDPKQAYVGALVIFGPGTGHHEAWVYEPDHKNGNPVLCSHGEPGLDFVRLHDMAAQQPPGVRLISVAHL